MLVEVVAANVAIVVSSGGGRSGICKSNSSSKQ